MSERNCNKCIHHTSGMCDSWNCKMQTVEDVKKEAVNEYVKAVVEELEEQRNIIFQDTDSEIKIVRANAWDKIDVLNKAIEIVKQGCVSDDVCEWALTDTRNVMPYKTSCDNEDLYDHRWKFCPYCGKKIKVVK